jgi:transmembrane sensor
VIRGSRSKEAVRAEAAAWVARLRDAHSSAEREAFEQWIAEDAGHKRAYDRALSAYEAAGALRSSALGRGRNLEAAFAVRRVPLARRFATAAVAALLLVGAYQFGSDFNPFRSVAIASVILSTGTEPRMVELADGSTVKMAPASEVRIELGRTGRLAEVRKGSARITVSHEERPFVIVAGSSRLDASKGSFDARLNDRGGDIVPVADGAGSGTAGQGGKDSQAMLDFDAEPLGSAVALINREQAGPAIEIDRDLAQLPVTGVFQRGGARSAARSLALAFNLELVETPRGTLRLVPKK